MNWGTLLGSQHFGGRGGMLELRDGNKKNEEHLFTHMDLHKTNQQVVNALLEHFWC
jgi:hypothetical protein